MVNGTTLTARTRQSTLKLYSKGELAHFLGVSPATITYWLKLGIVNKPTHKCLGSAKLYYSYDEVCGYKKRIK